MEDEHPDLPLIGEGTTDRGEHWIVRASGSAKDLRLYAELTVPARGSCAGGSGGGAANPPGRQVAVHILSGVDGARLVYATGQEPVTAVRVSTVDGESVPLDPLDCADLGGLTVFAGALPFATVLDDVRAFDGDGGEVERAPIEHEEHYRELLDQWRAAG